MGAHISIFAQINKQRIDRSGRVPIRLRIDLDRKPVAYDTIADKPYKIPLAEWDEKAMHVKKSYANAQLINYKIDARIAELQGIFIVKEEVGYKMNKTNIQLLIAGRDPGQSFYAFCRKQIDEKYDSSETKRTYRSEVTKLEKYAGSISFRDIDYEFLQAYVAWMRDKKGNSPNTIWKSLKWMNTMLNDAIKIGGYIQINPFHYFDRGKYQQTPRTFLTKTERPKIEKLMNQPIPEEIMKVTAYMLLMCYAGLRFEDAMSFNYDEHIIDDERLIILTEKKDVLVNIKLYPKLRKVVLFLKDHPLHMKNRDFNDSLKTVMALAGIDKHVTAHVGRHTFGRLLAENGVDKDRAQKLLGHKDKRSTDVYYHIMDSDLDNEVDQKLGNLA